MNHPNLYHKANKMQRHEAEQSIKDYFHKLQWRSDGKDSLLDVGSGSGDVLMDFIYTRMPEKFERIVGSDISPIMVNYAQDYYSSYEKCQFKVLDIATEKDLPGDLQSQFDHVTSFYCLHWIENKRQALRNINNVLKADGGDCLLVLLASHAAYDIYKIQSECKTWSSYMTDVNQQINTLHSSKDPKFEFSTLLKEAGFSDIHVDVLDRVCTYESPENLKDNMKAVNAFVDRMPLSLQDSYMNDFIDVATSLNLRQNHPSRKSDYVFNVPYKVIIAYAKKYPQ